MAENSKISWTDHTANLWWGCTEVHAGCDNCYARVLANRWGHDLWGNDKPRKASKSVFNDLAKFQAKAKEAGVIHRVFINSMADIFEKSIPAVDSKGNMIPLDDGDTVGMDTGDLRQQLFSNISRNDYPNLLFLLLTKRPSNINKMIPEAWKGNPPENVMFGTSVVDQETQNKLLPQLLEVNGYKFLSIEPQIGLITMNKDWLAQINWVIQGGESGHGARQYILDWASWMQAQCQSLNVPYFHKQTGAVYAKANHFTHDKSHGANPLDWPEWLRVQQLPRIPILSNN